MGLNFRYVPGKRTVKSAVVVMLCMLYGFFSGRAVVVTISALVCLRPTVDESKQLLLTRTIATLLGGLIGYGMLHLGRAVPGYEAFWFVLLVPLAVLLNIYICNVLGVRDAIVLSCAVLVILSTDFEVPVGRMLSVFLERVLDTLVGAVIATGVNHWLWNPGRADARRTRHGKR